MDDFRPPKVSGYTLGALLGEGGMGRVYRATDATLGRDVAIKMMLPQYSQDPHWRERFLREAKALARVDHKHVIAIYGCGVEKELVYMVMPLLKGVPLDKYLEAQPRPSLAEVCRIGRQVALGLHAAHEVSLVHRDVKPGNIWITENNGDVKVLDFGLVRDEAATQLNQTVAGIGTILYMAPEQLNSARVDAKADLFALGCILYEMLTGYLPFAGATRFEVMVKLTSFDPPPVHVQNPSVPRPISELVAQLMAKDPTRRPANGRDVAMRLRAAGSQPAPALAPPPPPPAAPVRVATPILPLVQVAVPRGIKTTAPVARETPTVEVPRVVPRRQSSRRPAGPNLAARAAQSVGCILAWALLGAMIWGGTFLFYMPSNTPTWKGPHLGYLFAMLIINWPAIMGFYSLSQSTRYLFSLFGAFVVAVLIALMTLPLVDDYVPASYTAEAIFANAPPREASPLWFRGVCGFFGAVPLLSWCVAVVNRLRG